MKVAFAGQVPKDPSYPAENEDYFEFGQELERIALSDGASESYDSRTWAKILVQGYLRTPFATESWLLPLVEEYYSHFDVANMSWSKQSAFGRGSFATLLGVEVGSIVDTINVVSVGDTLAVLLDGVDVLDSFPYQNATQFQQRPEILCTNTSHNSFVRSPDFNLAHQKVWSISESKTPTLLLMTDALGEWALMNDEEGNPQWGFLSSINELSVLESLVDSERKIKKMRTDDVSLIRVELR